jgi:hypothetical protein
MFDTVLQEHGFFAERGGLFHAAATSC